MKHHFVNQRCVYFRVKLSTSPDKQTFLKSLPLSLHVYCHGCDVIATSSDDISPFVMKFKSGWSWDASRIASYPIDLNALACSLDAWEIGMEDKYLFFKLRK